MPEGNLSRRTFLAAGPVVTAALPALSDPALSPVNAQEGRLSEAQFQALAERVSNWGRWGRNDELGALNLVTPETIKRASALIRDGVVVHCGGPIPALQPNTDDQTGKLELRIDAANDWGAVNDVVTLDVHGHLGLTHLDALGHVYYRGRHFNGRPFGGVLGNRVKGYGIDTARQGIVGRGVLIDLAAAVGKPWLEPQDRVTPAALRRAIEATGTALQPGDILIFNTGLSALLAASKNPPSGLAVTGGMQVECAEIVHQAQPSLVMSDVGMDSMPSEVTGVLIPWHILCIVQMGVRLVDCAYLGDLLATTKRMNRASFFCTIAPVEYTGATSSPVNPICIF